MEKTVLTPIKALNKEIEACKICGSTTLPTRRTVLSNTKGKTKLGNDFQAYCAIDVEETERRIVYCCRNCKSKLETLIKKINEIREAFIHVNQGKIKRLHKPTGETPNPKLKKSCIDANSKGNDKDGTEDSESEQRQVRRKVPTRKLTFETDSTTSTSIDRDSSLKSDVTCENAKHMDCEPLPQNPEGETENNFVNNSGGLASPLIHTNRMAFFPKGYFGLTMGPLTNYVAPGLNAFQLQTSMTPPVVRPYPCIWPRQLVSIVPRRVNQVQAPSAEQVENLTVTIKYKTGLNETIKLNETRKSIGISLLKGSDDDVAKAIMKDTLIKRSCTNSLLTELKDQCIGLCRLNNPSILRSKKVRDIVSFKFGDFVEKELKERADLLYQILRTVVSSDSNRNTTKTMEKKTLAMAMAAGILLKARNKDMCLTQVVTSLILHNGGLSQMVSFKLLSVLSVFIRRITLQPKESKTPFPYISLLSVFFLSIFLSNFQERC